MSANHHFTGFGGTHLLKFTFLVQSLLVSLYNSSQCVFFIPLDKINHVDCLEKIEFLNNHGLEWFGLHWNNCSRSIKDQRSFVCTCLHMCVSDGYESRSSYDFLYGDCEWGNQGLPLVMWRILIGPLTVTMEKIVRWSRFVIYACVSITVTHKYMITFICAHLNM